MSWCSFQVDISRRVTLEVLPKVLILHLKRFIYSKTGSQKLQRVIDYPLELSIGKGKLARKQALRWRKSVNNNRGERRLGRCRPLLFPSLHSARIAHHDYYSRFSPTAEPVHRLRLTVIEGRSVIFICDTLKWSPQSLLFQ